MKLFDRFKSKKIGPTCTRCGRNSNEIRDAHRARGITPIGLAVGICPKCRRSYCSEHSNPGGGGMEDNKCPTCDVELDFYWHSPPTGQKPWRFGPLEGLET